MYLCVRVYVHVLSIIYVCGHGCMRMQMPVRGGKWYCLPSLHFGSDEINRKIDQRRNEIDENQSQRRSLEQEVHDLRERKVNQLWGHF